jgi:hypothetical protein
MNTAIQDGFALGWRLAWVLRGWAESSLLDGYESHRRPIGARNTARSATMEPRDNSKDYLDDLAGRIPHAWVSRDGGVVSTLDLVGPGLTLITGPYGRAWSQAVLELGAALPVAVHGVDEGTAQRPESATGCRRGRAGRDPDRQLDEPDTDRLAAAIHEQ